MVAECQSYHICQEVCPCCSWCYHHWTQMHLQQSHPSWEQSPKNPWLAWVPKPHPSMQISRCVQCPSNFHLRFCINCLSAGQLDLERSSIWVGRVPAVVNAASEGCNMSFPHILSSGLWIWMWGHPCSRHICDCNQIYLVPGGGWWKEVSKSVWLDQPYWSWESLFPS